MPQHYERRQLPYTPKQMFDLVADIERYPEFLPWCLAAKITGRDGNAITADLVIGYRAIRESFTSLVDLEPGRRISVRYVSGPLAKLTNEWSFEPAGRKQCTISFFVDFRFRSLLLSRLMDMFFDVAFRRMVTAFETRAKQLYG
jgi:coenzyme Q-binding protein COQ10